LPRNKPASEFVSGWVTDTQTVQDSVGTSGEDALRRREVATVDFVIARFNVDDHELAIFAGFDAIAYSLLVYLLYSGRDFLGRVIRVRHAAILLPSPTRFHEGLEYSV
jgi:hypothetical protein